MGTQESHKIELQLNKSAYVNGEQISGYVSLQLKKSLPVKVIKARVGGFEKAVVYIPPNSNFNKNTPFFWQDTVIWSPSIEDKEELEVGAYNFPFSFQLPAHLPPSFNYNNLVSVAYLASCFIETNGDQLLTSKNIEFNIYGTLPNKWNDIMRNTKAGTAKANKQFLFKKSKPVELSAHLTQTDFQIGDKIPIHLQIRNHSSTTLETIVILLIQYIDVDTEEMKKKMPRTKILSTPFPRSIPQFSKSNTSRFTIDVTIPQINGDDEVYPTTIGKTIKVTHSIIVMLPGPDISVEIPIVIWDSLVTAAGNTSAVPQSNAQVEWDIDWLPVWVDDEAVSSCSSCNQSFTVFNRKHHCRSCGQVFCTKCTPQKFAMKHLGYSEPVRICTKCYSSIPQSERIQAITDEELGLP